VHALRGVDMLLMVSAKESPDRLMQHRSFIEVATAAGVSHVVYTSFAEATAGATFTFA
jgi:NAD(P)H dehydrogenase (quinone)